MVELGEIVKPKVERFSGKRKLYCVPNVYSLMDAGDEYKEYNELVNKFWDEVAQHIERVEAAGKIKKIFCEGIYTQGEEALSELAKINEKAHIIVKKKVESGAVLLPVESKEIFDTYVDWRNCLAVVRTREVFSKVFEFYKDAYNKRLQHIQNIIEGNIAEQEAGMLIMVDEDRVKLQLADDIELFLVTPPSYDNLLRWFRDRVSKE